MAKQAGGIASVLLVAVVLTVCGAGGGVVVGLQLLSVLKAHEAAKSPVEAVKPVTPKFAEDTAIKDLPPIVTSLAGPGRNWVRLQASIVYDKRARPDPSVLAGQITNDVLTFLRTVSIDQIQGPSGLQHLREDLDDRVGIRSDGDVRELVIQGLVLQ